MFCFVDIFISQLCNMFEELITQEEKLSWITVNVTFNFLIRRNAFIL